jgi:hypothetical protein
MQYYIKYTTSPSIHTTNFKTRVAKVMNEKHDAEAVMATQVNFVAESFGSFALLLINMRLRVY